jgi:hypothetical protein
MAGAVLVGHRLLLPLARHSQSAMEVLMERSHIEVTLRRFESPDETRVMEKGKFEVVHIGGLAVGRATYEPGWRWSEHVGPIIGAKRCTVAHVGLVGHSNGSAGGWTGVRASRRRAVLYSRRPARQLGGGEPAICVPSLYGHRPLCKIEMSDGPNGIGEKLTVQDYAAPELVS